MQPDSVISGSYTRDDGFGTRRLAIDPSLGAIEVLQLMPLLATPEAEAAIRARVLQLEGFGAPLLTPVYRVEREGEALRLVSAAIDGVPLCEMLAALEFGALTLSDDAVLELAAITVRAAGALHDILGPLSHGALNPAHVVFRRDGSVVFTDSVFGDVLQRLELNREELWRRFSLALPAAAAAPRFDRRADVAQLGSIVLAILMRRTLLAHEYPRSIADLVMSASTDKDAAPAGAPRMRAWLQQALHLQSRATFASASDAARQFVEVVDARRPQPRNGPAQLQAAIRGLLGESVAVPDSPPTPAPAPEPLPAPAGVEAARADPPSGPAPRGFSFLRSVLPHLRGN